MTGYEVQTLRLATQPFSSFLGAPSPALIPAAARLEQLAKAHGIPLLSIGCSNRPEDLEYIPGIIAATSSTSCSYALPPDPPLQLVQAAAAAVLEVARRTGVCEGGSRSKCDHTCTTNSAVALQMQVDGGEAGERILQRIQASNWQQGMRAFHNPDSLTLGLTVPPSPPPPGAS